MSIRQKMLNYIKEMAEKGATIEDKEGTIKFIPPARMEITPKDINDISNLHLRFLKKMQKGKLDKRILCFVENGKVVLQVV